MMRVQRYILRQATVAFFAGALGLTAIIWMTQALRQIDVVTSKGQTLAIFFAITALAVPALLVVVMPIALFGAVAFVLNRLNADSEWVALTAVGLSPGTLLRPFLWLSLGVCVAIGYLTLVALPQTFSALEAMATHLHADLIGNLVRPGAFVELESGFVFHIRERGADGSLHGLFIQDRRDPAHITTYFAESGRTVEKGGRTYLALSHGTTERPGGEGESAFVTFDEDALDLTELARKADVVKRPRERATTDLLFADPAEPDNKRQSGRLRAEIAERFTSPLYALVAPLVAFAGLGQPRPNRQGRTWALAAAALAFGAIRMAGVGAINLAANGPSGAILAYALPVLAILGASGVVLGLPAKIRRPARRLAAA